MTIVPWRERLLNLFFESHSLNSLSCPVSGIKPIDWLDSNISITRREFLKNFGVPVGILTGSLITAAFMSQIVPAPLALPFAMGLGGWLRGKLRGDERPILEGAKWAGLSLFAQWLASCSPIPREDSSKNQQPITSNVFVKPDFTKTPLPQPLPTKETALNAYRDSGKKIPSESAFFSIASQLLPSERSIGLETLITDPVQKDSIARALLENSIAVNKGYAEIQRAAIANGTAIGLSGCSDSRHTIPFLFPTTQAGAQLDVYLKTPVGVTLQTATIGTQPAIFDKGVNMSFFVTHSKCAGAVDGCGALGGIKAILEGKEAELIHHGVSTGTINQLKRLISMGADTDPNIWAETGARMQAELNFKAHGTNHFVAYGLTGHADGTFEAKFVVDAFGNKYSIDEFELLKEYAEYFNRPHPILERVAAGQTPKINLLNGSKRFSSSVLFGDMAQEKGVIFKVTSLDMTNKTLTVDEARAMIEGVDYSLTHLKQDGKVLMLVADDVKSMSVLRTTLLAEAKGIKNFIDDGGVIVELIPNANGRFDGFLTVKNKLTLGHELSLLRGAYFSQTTLDEGLLKEAQEIVTKRVKAGAVPEATGSKTTAILGKLKPLGRFVNFALGRLGDAAIITSFVDWFRDNILQESIKWYVPSENIKDTTVKAISIDEAVKYMEKNSGANPYLQNFEIIVSQDQMRDAYRGALAAWMKYGPKDQSPGSNPTPPWSNMNKEDLGKILCADIPGTPNNDPSFARQAYINTSEQHLFYALIQPEPDLVEGNIKYSSSDPNQRMMLTDILSGVPIFGSIPTGNNPRIIVSVTPSNPNVAHFWQVETNPEKRTYKLCFIYAKRMK